MYTSIVNRDTSIVYIRRVKLYTGTGSLAVFANGFRICDKPNPASLNPIFSWKSTDILPFSAWTQTLYWVFNPTLWGGGEGGSLFVMEWSNCLPWSICGKSEGTSGLFCVCARLHEEPQHWPGDNKQGTKCSFYTGPNSSVTWFHQMSPQPLMDTHLRERGSGYVHVTPCRHRQQWRNVWATPVALGTVSRGRAHPSCRILPPRGLVCQMAERKESLESLVIRALMCPCFLTP